MEGERFRAIIWWSGVQWLGRVPGVDGCEARATTKQRCLDRLADRTQALLGVQVVSLIVEEERPALVGMSGAAAILRWDRRKFATYVARGHLPQPGAELAGGRVWRRSDIETYALAREKDVAG